ncbi:hypothetical protein [Quatrionicoccus australiensis]|uniref:hypothetical protein n=1 Tax=Quatrionicoccus australiensis TaxID=138118 RepID=UPI001CF8B01A|nr:hypothetical protein [Quatrionicoccus australiensis]UCV15100.1 hypothetical protein KI612_19655 [Quatrionicoccus australiensis]
MARILLGSASPKLDTSSLTSTKPSSNLPPADLERRLRSKRSMAYIASLQRLDAGGHSHTREALDALLQAIQHELPEISIEHLPVGIVAKCYLGEPYEVHTLDRQETIIQHYKRHQAMPPMLERARSLAMHPGYVFIEVYTDRLIAISNNGDTSMVKG